jgi:bifunctional non-homologous end joining protein LigD
MDRMNELLRSLPQSIKGKLKEINLPGWIEPMLATLVQEPFSDEGWIYERKFDGERCLAYCKGDTVRLLSRNHRDLNTHYPELVEELERRSSLPAVVDGEVVVFEGDLTSFSKLQKRMHIQDPCEVRDSDIKVYYYLFDILYLDGYDLTQIPLRNRKWILKNTFKYHDPLRYTPHRNRNGEAYFQQACRKGWEGIIAKDAGSGYLQGRSKKWLKFKCLQEQEFVIGGFTDPQGSRIGFGALLVGYYQGNELHYAGKVGTGYDDRTLRELKEKLSFIELNTPPFIPDAELPTKDVHWTEAKLVAQIGFEEWTEYDKLRQPRFLGIREDKEPRSVRKEVPKA